MTKEARELRKSILVTHTLHENSADYEIGALLKGFDAGYEQARKEAEGLVEEVERAKENILRFRDSLAVNILARALKKYKGEDEK